jgi:hypothetical protein
MWAGTTEYTAGCLSEDGNTYVITNNYNTSYAEWLYLAVSGTTVTKTVVPIQQAYNSTVRNVILSRSISTPGGYVFTGNVPGTEPDTLFQRRVYGSTQSIATIDTGLVNAAGCVGAPYGSDDACFSSYPISELNANVITYLSAQPRTTYPSPSTQALAGGRSGLAQYFIGEGAGKPIYFTHNLTSGVLGYILIGNTEELVPDSTGYSYFANDNVHNIKDYPNSMLLTPRLQGRDPRSMIYVKLSTGTKPTMPNDPGYYMAMPAFRPIPSLATLE